MVSEIRGSYSNRDIFYAQMFGEKKIVPHNILLRTNSLYQLDS